MLALIFALILVLQCFHNVFTSVLDICRRPLSAKIGNIHCGIGVDILSGELDRYRDS